MNDIMGGIREQLSTNLLRYAEDFDGVVLSYSNERLLSTHAELHPYFPYLHLQVQADIVLFKPDVGMHLVGNVIKVGADYIGLLVLGVFNAAIGAQHIRREFKCLQGGGGAGCDAWVSSKDPKQVIEVGSRVRFKVEGVLDHVTLFSITGSLMDAATTGLEDALAGPSGKAAVQPAQQQRKRKLNQTGLEQRQQQQQQEEAGADGHQGRRNKKEQAGEEDRQQTTGKAEEACGRQKRQKNVGKAEEAGEEDRKQKKQEKKRRKEVAAADGADQTQPAARQVQAQLVGVGEQQQQQQQQSGGKQQARRQQQGSGAQPQPPSSKQQVQADGQAGAAGGRRDEAVKQTKKRGRKASLEAAAGGTPVAGVNGTANSSEENHKALNLPKKKKKRHKTQATQ